MLDKVSNIGTTKFNIDDSIMFEHNFNGRECKIYHNKKLITVEILLLHLVHLTSVPQ